MGLGFVLLFWLAVIVALAATWLLSLGAWLWGLARRSRVLAWLGGVPLVASSVAAIAWLALMLGAIVSNVFAVLRAH